MKTNSILIASVLLAFSVNLFFARFDVCSNEERIRYSLKNPNEHIEGGHSKVAVDILKRMTPVAIEEAWGVLHHHRYHFQFTGDRMNIYRDRVLDGRPVTVAFLPGLLDLHKAIVVPGKIDGQCADEIQADLEHGKKETLQGSH